MYPCAYIYHGVLPPCCPAAYFRANEEENTTDENKAETRAYIPPPVPGEVPEPTLSTPAQIANFIESGHPDIIQTMTSYGMPIDTIRTIIRRVVGITLTQLR